MDRRYLFSRHASPPQFAGLQSALLLAQRSKWQTYQLCTQFSNDHAIHDTQRSAFTLEIIFWGPSRLYRLRYTFPAILIFLPACICFYGIRNVPISSECSLSLFGNEATMHCSWLGWMHCSRQEEPVDRRSTRIATTRFPNFKVEMLESFTRIIFVLDPGIAA